jgi:hypothetical protein
MVSPALVSSVLGVAAYYVFTWMMVGRDPEPGTIVTIYSPPREISPAMLRYVWKESFDDRTVWSSLLSLVSKGLATMQSEDSLTVLRPVHGVALGQTLLHPEERIFFEELLRSHKKKGMIISMLDGRMCLLVAKMAEIVRREAVGRWFEENREYVIFGTLLSAVALCVAAMPRRMDEWFVLVASFALMAPGAFYLLLLLLRLRDLFRAARMKFDVALVGRTALLSAFLACCLASILMGSVVLGGTFGLPVVAVAGLLALLNLSFLHLMKAPTAEGRKLLDEIEGFRVFLKSVEQPTMNRSEAPSQQPGVYEKYLPYAVALEVEQAWADRFVALASSYHRPEPLLGAESLYLGMWNGKPVEVFYKPQPIRHSGA